MLDPIIDAVKAFLAWIASIPGRLLGYVSFPSATHADGTPRRRPFLTWLRRLSAVVLLVAVLAYMLPFAWATSGVTGWDVSYPKTVLETMRDSPPAGERAVAAAGGAPSCGRSRVVGMMEYLIDFSVNENAWIPSMPQSKFGLFGIPWENTPWFDNKASFQHGTLVALRRMAVELTDQVGRVRGTSEADPDLAAARGLLQTDDELWWFNPFSERLPFGPVTPAPTIYRDALSAYRRFDDRLASCQALFDLRSDNLKVMLDRISNDMGSVVDALSKRSTARVWDVRTRTFVSGEGNDWGWFDLVADNRFNHASGMMYAYHGLLDALRVDFADVIQARGLGGVWDRMEASVAEAVAMDPLIVSNGREDGFMFPDHLAAMAQRMLLARTNMGEIGDILDR